MYDLVANGLVDIKRFLVLNRVARDPLSGVVDGSNVFFMTTYSPVFEGTTFSLYEGATPVSSGSYTVDYEAGMVEVDAAPSNQLYANYDLTPFTNTELKRIMIAAFDHMEAKLNRGFRLSSGSAAYTEATESSSAMYVLDKSTVSDPTTGSLVFSTSRIQRGFLLACAEYTMATRNLDREAGGFMWREDRGITVDKSRVPANRLQHIMFLEKRVDAYRMAAADEHYSGGAHLGGYLSSPGTKDYFYDYEWQTDSKDEDWRGVYAGNV